MGSFQPFFRLRVRLEFEELLIGKPWGSFFGSHDDGFVGLKSALWQLKHFGMCAFMIKVICLLSQVNYGVEPETSSPTLMNSRLVWLPAQNFGSEEIFRSWIPQKGEKADGTFREWCELPAVALKKFNCSTPHTACSLMMFRFHQLQLMYSSGSYRKLQSWILLYLHQLKISHNFHGFSLPLDAAIFTWTEAEVFFSRSSWSDQKTYSAALTKLKMYSRWLMTSKFLFASLSPAIRLFSHSSFVCSRLFLFRLQKALEVAQSHSTILWDFFTLGRIHKQLNWNKFSVSFFCFQMACTQWDKLSPNEFQQLQDLAGCKFSWPKREMIWNFFTPSTDSNKKLEDVLEEFCGPTSKYKFNQDDVSIAPEHAKGHSTAEM